MEKLQKDQKINVWVGTRSLVDMALRRIVESELRASSAIKHRALLGELVLRGITPKNPGNLNAVALQLMMSMGELPPETNTDSA